MHVLSLLLFSTRTCIKSVFLEQNSSETKLNHIMSGSDENEQNEVGGDPCLTHELDHLFDESLRIASEEAISLQKDYILHLDSTR